MSSTARLRDGTRIVYDIHGRDDGRPRLILIHSLGMDRVFWAKVTPVLAQHAAVLTYDCRGHGQSDKPKGPYRVEPFADDFRDGTRPELLRRHRLSELTVLRQGSSDERDEFRRWAVARGGFLSRNTPDSVPLGGKSPT